MCLDSVLLKTFSCFNEVSLANQISPTKQINGLTACTSVQKSSHKREPQNGVGSSPVQVLMGGNNPNFDHGKINGSNLLKDSSRKKYISSSEEFSSSSEPLIAALDGSDFNYLLQ